MSYTTKQVGSKIEVLRDGKHIATYDPVDEETTFTSKDNERYSNHVGRAINDLLESKPVETPPVETPKEILKSTPPANPSEVRKIVPFAEATKAVKNMAADLYTTYCAAVGGKAFNGDPLPSAEEFFADPAKTLQSNAWLYTAEAKHIMVGDKTNDTEKLTESKRDKAQLLELRAENARLRDELAKLRGTTTGINRPPERFSDAIDESGAPAKDPTLGDLTPAYVEWAKENMAPEIFQKRYHNRLK